MIGYKRITRAEFYHQGGFANHRFVRVTRGGSRAYYER